MAFWETAMPLLRRGTNPFYVLLVITGTVFAVTACAYGVMTVKHLHGGSAAAQGWLMETLARRGEWILAGEIGVLAVFTFLAMATDHWFEKRPSEKSGES
jgi:hypothetical protein